MACNGDCSNCNSKEKSAEDCRLKSTMERIKHKVVVMSGKGGVGKSTVSVNLAVSLAMAGYSVGLLDVDIHGPSVPQMLKMGNCGVMMNGDLILPQQIGSLKVLSLGFMFDDPEGAIVWRGPMKIGVIKQFLSDVDWGDLDYLVIDCPPGTGDEPLTVCQLIDGDKGAIIVTTPQQVAANDVIKSLNFCKQMEFPILGIVENMSGFVCPDCGKVTEIFASGAGEALAEKFGVKLLAKIPIDPVICQGGDAGTPFIQAFAKTVPGRIFAEMADKLFE